MQIVIPFDSIQAPEDKHSGGISIDFHGGQVRSLKTVSKEKTYRLRSLIILTEDFMLSDIRGNGAGQFENFAYSPTSAVVGLELPMPEWMMEPGQIITAAFLNQSSSVRHFGGYFVGDL